MARYTVSGSRPYRGHRPGEEFEADLTETEETRAIARGAITATEGHVEDDDSAADTYIERDLSRWTADDETGGEDDLADNDEDEE